MVWTASGSKAIREAEEVGLIDGIQDLSDCSLDNLVLKSRNAERPLTAIRFGDVYAANGPCPIPPRVNALA
jgi:hypothetical protein